MDDFAPLTEEETARYENSVMLDYTGQRRLYADSVSTSEKLRARALRWPLNEWSNLNGSSCTIPIEANNYLS